MIRAIHSFGPEPGDYVPGVQTDIRVTIERARAKIAALPAEAVGDQPESAYDDFGADDLHPDLSRMLIDWPDFDARR